MSNNYKWYSELDMIDCGSFKACYQVCRQLRRHRFEKIYDDNIGNTRVITFEKNHTQITVYIYNELTDPLTRKKISWCDYIQRLTEYYTRRCRRGDKHV